MKKTVRISLCSLHSNGERSNKRKRYVKDSNCCKKSKVEQGQGDYGVGRRAGAELG